jgi:hypothetical protein
LPVRLSGNDSSTWRKNSTTLSNEPCSFKAPPLHQSRCF